MAGIEVLPTVIDMTLVRKTDNKLRATIYYNGDRTDLTGDTLTLVAKDKPGGTVKVSVTGVLEPQSGSTLGDVIFTVPKESLVGPGYPNDSPIVDIAWPYQIQRLHGGLLTVPIEGTLTLGPTI